MSNLLSVFDDENDDKDGPQSTTAPPLLMTSRQRTQIRSLFGALGITSAAQQFEVTAELIGVRIASVNELQAAAAQRLIAGLQRRVDSAGRTLTGNAWDDREENTWIDRL